MEYSPGKKMSLQKSLLQVQQELDSQHFSDALNTCRAILETNPDSFEANHAAGLSCYFLHDFEKAVAYFSEGVRLNPNSFKLFLNISNLYQELGNYEEAINSLDRCMALEPKNPVSYGNMGNVLSKLNLDPELVVKYYQMALSYDESYAQAYMNLASYLSKIGRGEVAFEVIKKGVEKCPSHPGIIALYAMCCADQVGPRESELAYKKLLSIQPSSSVAIVKLLAFSKKRCDWEGENIYKEKFLNMFSKSFSDEVKVSTVESLLNFIGPFELLSVDVGLDKLQRVTEMFSIKRQRNIDPMKFMYSKIEGKIKIGYVSADFNSHAVGLLIRDLFKYHDREKFEVCCYYLRGKNYQDEVTAEIVAASDSFKFCGGGRYSDIARLINEDEINILVDLSGYTAEAQPQIFDVKPAPIQCQFLGYPGTLGSKMVDYYITTPIYTPASVSKHFTENMAYLPEVGIATKRFDYALDLPSRKEFGIPEDKFIFYSFSTFYRITKNTFDAWIEVLKRAEHSVLWLLDENSEVRDHLLSYASSKGVEKERLIFTRKERITDRGIHRLADCLLDTIALPSGTAAIISLSDSVPIVSMSGDTPQTRTCLSMMSGVGMDHLVSENVDEFIDVAVKMATDDVFYKNQVELLKGNLNKAPLFDQPRFVKHLECAYQKMINLYTNGEDPSLINVSKID